VSAVFHQPTLNLALGLVSVARYYYSNDNDGDGDENGMFSDRCISGSGAVWVFCLASGGLSGVIWVSFERRVSFGTPLGSLWAPFGAWAPPAPVWGPRAASAFHS
jgi:hypothetical protein